jgi:two-component system OmpR family sensor kinase
MKDPRLGNREIVTLVSPVRIRGDLDAVGLAVRNLLENALVHGAGGTRIVLQCEETRTLAFLSVVDDGPGVPPGEVALLKRRFARSSTALGSGAGLGLSIVDTLARRMGARLLLRSPATGQSHGFEARLVWRRKGGAAAEAPS